MEKRTCPNCGKDWYSADAESDWVCEHCGTLIPIVKGENANGNK